MFNGPEYDVSMDRGRLQRQHERVKDLMIDGVWRTLEEIAVGTGDPPASISAQLRHLRKLRFGSYVVERRARGDRAQGLYEYKLLPPKMEVVETPTTNEKINRRVLLFRLSRYRSLCEALVKALEQIGKREWASKLKERIQEIENAR